MRSTFVSRPILTSLCRSTECFYGIKYIFLFSFYFTALFENSRQKINSYNQLGKKQQRNDVEVFCNFRNKRRAIGVHREIIKQNSTRYFLYRVLLAVQILINVLCTSTRRICRVLIERARKSRSNEIVPQRSPLVDSVQQSSFAELETHAGSRGLFENYRRKSVCRKKILLHFYEVRPTGTCQRSSIYSSYAHTAPAILNC